MAWTPDPHLVNKATSGGLRNARSLIDIVEHRQQKFALQKIGEMANLGQFNDAGSELIKLGKFNAGSQLLNISDGNQDVLNEEIRPFTEWNLQTIHTYKPTNPCWRPWHGCLQ